MHREDNSKYLLFIEPPKREKLTMPIIDELTDLMQKALGVSKNGTANYSNLEDEGNFEEGNGWRGFHTTDCGQTSSNKEYLLENGMITNSLCVFYLQWYRNSIPETEIEKLMSLKKFYGV